MKIMSYQTFKKKSKQYCKDIQRNFVKLNFLKQ